MLVLALDTSTPAVTAGIVDLHVPADGGEPTCRTLAQRVTVNPRAHGELLTPHLLSATQAAGTSLGELDAVVCGAGPGPFTGLRAGLVTAAALGQALVIPVHAVCSLDAIAAEAVHAATQGAGARGAATQGAAARGAAARGAAARGAAATGEAAGGDLLVVTDARRREVYWAVYDAAARRRSGPAVGAPAGVERGAAVRVAGHGAEVYPEAFQLPVVEPLYPTPRGLVRAAADALLSDAEPEPLTPLYLRRPDAQEPGERKRVLA